jgi:hypothetical protein
MASAWGVIGGVVIVIFGFLEFLFGGFGTTGLAGASGAGLVPYSEVLAIITGLLLILGGAIMAWRA